MFSRLLRFDYTARTDNEMSFKKGEQMKVKSNDNQNWWEAESLATRAIGWIPSNYVVPDSSKQKKKKNEGDD